MATISRNPSPVISTATGGAMNPCPVSSTTGVADDTSPFIRLDSVERKGDRQWFLLRYQTQWYDLQLPADENREGPCTTLCHLAPCRPPICRLCAHRRS